MNMDCRIMNPKINANHENSKKTVKICLMAQQDVHKRKGNTEDGQLTFCLLTENFLFH